MSGRQGSGRLGKVIRSTETTVHPDKILPCASRKSEGEGLL